MVNEKRGIGGDTCRLECIGIDNDIFRKICGDPEGLCRKHFMSEHSLIVVYPYCVLPVLEKVNILKCDT